MLQHNKVLKVSGCKPSNWILNDCFQISVNICVIFNYPSSVFKEMSLSEHCCAGIDSHVIWSPEGFNHLPSLHNNQTLLTNIKWSVCYSESMRQRRKVLGVDYKLVRQWVLAELKLHKTFSPTVSLLLTSLHFNYVILSKRNPKGPHT